VYERTAGRRRRGRPVRPPEEARSHRVVTFVTQRELEALERIAEAEDRSLSAVVHRIIREQLRSAVLTGTRGVQRKDGNRT